VPYTERKERLDEKAPQVRHGQWETEPQRERQTIGELTSRGDQSGTKGQVVIKENISAHTRLKNETGISKLIKKERKEA